MEQLEEGRDYYVIVTTASGLYRYDMSDIVRVNGCVQATPTLAFVQKGKGITSITGEKLHEGQAISAVTSVLGPRGLTPDFFIMLADADRARYLLYLEVPAGQPPFSDLARQIDERLAEENVEYKSKRASSRLNQLAVNPSSPAPGTHSAVNWWPADSGMCSSNICTSSTATNAPSTLKNASPQPKTRLRRHAHRAF